MICTTKFSIIKHQENWNISKSCFLERLGFLVEWVIPQMTEDMRLTVATCVTWLVHMCDVTRSHVWRDSFTYVTWLIHMCDVTHSHVWHGSFTCATWLILKGDVTHSYMGHALFMCHDSFICVAWLIHECDRTQSYGQHDRTHSYRVAKFYRMSYLYRSFPAKEPYN